MHQATRRVAGQFQTNGIINRQVSSEARQCVEIQTIGGDRATRWLHALLGNIRKIQICRRNANPITGRESERLEIKGHASVAAATAQTPFQMRQIKLGQILAQAHPQVVNAHVGGRRIDTRLVDAQPQAQGAVTFR